MFDLVIRNGIVIDGSGAERRISDVAVQEGRIAAVGPVAGVRAIDPCTFERAVPVIAFHGTADTFVPYEGGLGESVSNLPSPDGSGKPIGSSITTRPGTKKVTVPEAVRKWAKRNGCGKKRADRKTHSIREPGRPT